MRHFSSRRHLRTLVCFLVAAPAAMLAQTGNAPASSERGWGSSWQEPANEDQRKKQELVRQMNAAVKAKNFHSVVELGTRLIAVEPNSPTAHLGRAWAFNELKEFDRALLDIERARDLAQKENQPKLVSSILASRATLYERQKNYTAAVSDLQASLKLDDKNAGAVNGLAWLRATAPDATFRDGREGVRLAEKAVAMSPSANAYSALDTLAAAYAESGDYPRAVEFERRAMTTAETQVKDPGAAQKFQQGAAKRLQLFEQHQAYHADLP